MQTLLLAVLQQMQQRAEILQQPQRVWHDLAKNTYQPILRLSTYTVSGEKETKMFL